MEEFAVTSLPPLERDKPSDLQVATRAIHDAVQPWREVAVFTNLLWAIALLAIFLSMYFAPPVEIEQVQDFSGQQQEQTLGGDSGNDGDS
jgi:hypothetical protein